MNCPRCGSERFQIGAACPECDFSAEARLLEQFAQITYLLKETSGWTGLPSTQLEAARKPYLQQQRRIEAELGLRKLPTQAEIAAARQDLAKQMAYRNALEAWLTAGILDISVAAQLEKEAADHITTGQSTLAEASGEIEPLSKAELAAVRLETTRFLAARLAGMKSAGQVVDLVAWSHALDKLKASIASQEIELGLRPKPEAAPPAAAAAPLTPTAPAPARVAAPPPAAVPPKPLATQPAPPPSQPWNWERIFETLLSRRTLNVILFIGAGLLFAAAISLVVWNWQAFPPWLQVAILAGFTSLLFALGWYVRTRMKLRESGIALSAVAALLVPLDFYAFYLSGGFPPQAWPEVWLLASVVCLLVYLLSTWWVQAEFFGYLVALAAGSSLASGLHLAGLPWSWLPPALTGLGLALALLAEGLERRKIARLQVLVRPFWWAALIGGGVILVLETSWWLLASTANKPLEESLALCWWLGGLLFLFGALRHNSRMAGLAAALCFPIAVLFTQDLIFTRLQVEGAWNALGLAALAPLYLLAGWKLKRASPPSPLTPGPKMEAGNAEQPIPTSLPEEDGRQTPAAAAERARAWNDLGRTAIAGGILLGAVSAIWALPTAAALACTYLILAFSAALAAGLWQRPALLYLCGPLLMAAASGWVSARSAGLEQVGLAWALLSILYISAGLWLSRKAGAEQTARPGYDGPLYVLGWMTGGLALLPPLALFNRPALTYTLGNWIALQGWLAILAHHPSRPALQTIFFPLFPAAQPATPEPARTPEGPASNATNAQDAGDSAPERQPLPARGDRKWWPARTKIEPAYLHLWAGLLLLPWAWLVWTNRLPVEARLGLVFIALGGLMLLFSVGMQRLHDSYGLAWRQAAHLAVLAGLAVSLIKFDQAWLSVSLLLAAAFYFAAAILAQQRLWLYIGAALLPFGWVLGLDRLGVAGRALPTCLALLPPAYLAACALLEGPLGRRFKPAAGQPPAGVARRQVMPLYNMAALIGLAGFVWVLVLLLRQGYGETPYLWLALACLLLAASYAWQAWLMNREWPGHAAVWLGAIAGGLAVLQFSEGRGFSAAAAAATGLAYLLLERGLQTQGWRAAPRPGGRARYAWRLYRRPLLIAAWLVSLGAIGLAFFRNLAWLGGGTRRELWAAAALLIVCIQYALGAALFHRQPRFSRLLAWLAAILLIAPWTLVSLQLWRQGWFGLPGYAVCWLLLAYLELLASDLFSPPPSPPAPLPKGEAGEGKGSSNPPPLRWALDLPAAWRGHGWQRGPFLVAQLLAPFALLWGAGNPGVSSLAFGLGIGFYLLAAGLDLRFGRASPRFLYPAAFLAPPWGMYLLAHFAPQASQTAYAALALGFALPYLGLGRWLERRRGAVSGRRFALPLYLGAYLSLLAGLGLAAPDRPALIAALLFGVLVFGLSAWLFAEPLWVYPAAAAFPAALLLELGQLHVPGNRQGWGLLACAWLYLAIAAALRRKSVWAFGIPLTAAAFTLSALALPASSQDRPGAIVAYGAAALLYAVSAVWLRQPLLVSAAAGLALAPYWLALLQAGLQPVNYGLAWWPAIAAYLALGRGIQLNWDLPADAPSESGNRLVRWPLWLAENLARRWSFALYGIAFSLAALSGLLEWGHPSRLFFALALAAGAYALATAWFRGRGWLFLSALFAQFAWLAAILWIGEHAPAGTLARLALFFAPAVWLTALAGLAIQFRRGEPAPLRPSGAVQDGRALFRWPQITSASLPRPGRPTANESQAAPPPRSWSRPLYLLLALDLVFLLLASLTRAPESAWLSLSSAVLLGVLAIAWRSDRPAYAALAMGLLAVGQGLLRQQAGGADWAWRVSLLATFYGLAGYALRFVRRRLTNDPESLRFLRRRQTPLPPELGPWELPLLRFAWPLSFCGLLQALWFGADLVGLGLVIALDLRLVAWPDPERVRLLTGVLSVLGLFYLTAAVVERRRWLSYGALGLLLLAWCGEALLVWGRLGIQWYALPAGAYLLCIGYLEWKLGSRPLARWIDRAAILLLLGSAFWQSLGDAGGRYALLMGAECLLLVWWGSARRLKRFLYAGLGGITLDVVAQLVEPLLSANRWIVFGVAGVLLVALAILVERRLETVQILSREVRERLEKWE